MDGAPTLADGHNLAATASGVSPTHPKPPTHAIADLDVSPTTAHEQRPPCTASRGDDGIIVLDLVYKAMSSSGCACDTCRADDLAPNVATVGVGAVGVGEGPEVEPRR